MNGTQGTTLFLKWVSFLKLPVYPLQIPKPPSVKLTNEAIKSKVGTPLNYTFCPNPLIIQLWILKAHQGYLAPWSFLTRTTSSLFSLSFISWGNVKESEGNEHLSKRKTSRLQFILWERNFPCFQKKGLVLWMHSFQFPVPSYPI